MKKNKREHCRCGYNRTVNYEHLLERLILLDACAVSDALDSLNIPGAVDGLVRRSTRERVAGRVRTLKISAGCAARDSGVHLGVRSIQEAGDLDVIVVEQNAGISAACWGGILAHAAKLKRIRGIVVDGPARDIDEFGEVGIPVFSRSVTTRSARGRVHEKAINVAIEIGHVTVNPGDLVIGDGTGVVFIPASKAEAVITTAEVIVAAERVMIDAIHEGKPPAEVMDRDYESMLEKRG